MRKNSEPEIFVLRAEYQLKGMKPYYDFYRFSFMKFLNNEHPTSKLFGNQAADYIRRLSRGKDLARNMMRWGFGSTKDTPTPDKIAYELMKKYRIEGDLFYPWSHITGINRNR